MSRSSLATGKREFELAVHDPYDGVVNAFEPLRRAAGEYRADRHNRENCRQERDRERAQQGLLQLIGLSQAPPKHKHAAVHEPAGHKDGGLADAARIGQ